MKKRCKMRKITIDFTKENPCENTVLGYVGEHNATELLIIPPKELAENERVTGYAAAFTAGGSVVRSRTFRKDEELVISLWQQLTEHSILGVQLEAFDYNGDFVGKSVYVPFLRFLPSADGVTVETSTESSSVLSEIAANTSARHVHDNSEALDLLELTSGGLLDLNKKVYLEHSELRYRDFPNAHPIKAITDLESVLNGKALKDTGNIQFCNCDAPLETWEKSRYSAMNSEYWSCNVIKRTYTERLGYLDLVLVYGRITDQSYRPAWAIGNFVSIAGNSLTIKVLASSLDYESPVRGVDYWTAADKDEITQAVLAELPVWDGGDY